MAFGFSSCAVHNISPCMVAQSAESEEIIKELSYQTAAA
jgi:hypothetical protein